MDKLPRTLTHLVFNGKFNQKLENLPPNLIELSLSASYNQKVCPLIFCFFFYVLFYSNICILSLSFCSYFLKFMWLNILRFDIHGHAPRFDYETYRLDVLTYGFFFATFFNNLNKLYFNFIITHWTLVEF